MKTIFALLLMGSTTFASDELHLAAKHIQTQIQVYGYDLQAIEDISKGIPVDEDERTERDLAICELVGESSRSSSDLNRAIDKMMSKITDQTERPFLDRMIAQILRHNVALRGFCIQSYYGEYRDIPYLQSTVGIIREDFIELKPFLDKYIKTQTAK